MHTRSVRALGIVLISAGALAGCNSNDSIGAGPAASTSATSPGPSTDTSAASSNRIEYKGPTIPQGLWTRQVRPDLAFSFKVGNGVWAQYETKDGGAPVVGDSGTFTYDAEGLWVTVSKSTGCPGCVGVYRWSVDGQRLTLTVVPGHDEDAILKFVTEGTYQRSA